MAKMRSSGIDDIMKQFVGLEKDCSGIFDEAVEAGAAVLAEQVKDTSKSAFKDTAQLNQHLETTKASRNKKNSLISSSVQYTGDMADGTPVKLVVLAREYGTKSGEAKKPFMRQAIRKGKKAVISKMQETLDEGVKKVTG